MKDGFSTKQQLCIVSDVQVSVALSADINDDGLQDLVIAGRNVTGKYGLIPRSYILRNKGGNEFEDITARIAPELKFIGMVMMLLGWIWIKTASWIWSSWGIGCRLRFS